MTTPKTRIVAVRLAPTLTNPAGYDPPEGWRVALVLRTDRLEASNGPVFDVVAVLEEIDPVGDPPAP